MITLIDRSIENFLRKDIPLKNDEYDISFDLPSKEWTNKISTTKQTANIYLYHICDNSNANRDPWEPPVDKRGIYLVDRPHVRLDLYYIISCWSPAQRESSQNEHTLLSSLLGTLYKYYFLPEKYFDKELSKLAKDFKLPIVVGSPLVYKSEGIATNFWNALDQQLRPFIHLQVTAPAGLVKYWITGKKREQQEYGKLKKADVEWKEGMFINIGLKQDD